MTNTQQILNDLARVKALFQLRAITAAMGIEPEQCQTCGDHHEPDDVPFTCATGDGV